jgi:hypothetical protein
MAVIYSQHAPVIKNQYFVKIYIYISRICTIETEELDLSYLIMEYHGVRYYTVLNRQFYCFVRANICRKFIVFPDIFYLILLKFISINISPIVHLAHARQFLIYNSRLLPFKEFREKERLG